MVFRNIGLFARLDDQRIAGTVQALRAHLRVRGVNLIPEQDIFFDLFNGDIASVVEQVHDKLDLGVAIGGDGTMLHLARHFSWTRVPLIGVNLGRLGFLTDISAERMIEEFNEILDGRFYTERRILIQASVYRGNELVAEGVALNDAVISKGETGRMIEYSWWVDNEMVGTTRGDGVIITTPTGSTAYALSAGGPILHPTLPAISVVPICPHTVSHRPIVLDDTSVIKIKINDFAKAGGHVFLDGLDIAELKGDETILIRKSDGQSVLVRAASHNHFEALRSKLGWAG
jgi:NAD+ kinase